MILLKKRGYENHSAGLMEDKYGNGNYERNNFLGKALFCMKLPSMCVTNMHGFPGEWADR